MKLGLQMVEGGMKVVEKRFGNPDLLKTHDSLLKLPKHLGSSPCLPRSFLTFTARLKVYDLELGF